tara:strand:- start:3236 stop:3418 length:183 start_codon:yes stop_codon:yes gene_type:complete
MKIQDIWIEASDKSDAKTKVRICLALSGFVSSDYKLVKIKKSSKTEFEIEVSFKGDRGLT